MIKHYKLVDGQPVEIPMLEALLDPMPFEDTVVKHTSRGGILVSTIFLQMGTIAGPRWETMILGYPHGEWRRQRSSREEALRDHAEAVALVERMSDRPWYVKLLARAWRYVS